jgi:alcohol dehydrogenase
MTADERPTPFRFEYRPGTVRYGTDSVANLGADLAAADCESALVVTGRTVGETAAVMDPVRDGLGDRLAGVVAETTPEKRLATAAAAAEAMTEAGADALVGVGGGSSLDVATVASVVAASDRSLADLARELADRGTIAVPDGDLAPVVAVPTTLAGAELSQAAGVTAESDAGLEDPVSGGLSDERLFPTAVVADPRLVATTPTDVLAPSAMNGFDKGIEALYAPSASLVTDATARRGLRLCRESLPALGGDPGLADVERAVAGVLLCQYGVSRPDGTSLGLLHAFGHGLRKEGGLHQGIAHGAVAPQVLRYMFDHVDARREELADALGGGSAGADRDPAVAADTAIQGVRAVRDGLDLPDGLEATGIDRDALRAVAEEIVADPLVANVPEGLEVTTADVLDVVEAAW